MPRLETPRLATGTRITVAFEHSLNPRKQYKFANAFLALSQKLLTLQKFLLSFQGRNVYANRTKPKTLFSN